MKRNLILSTLFVLAAQVAFAQFSFTAQCESQANIDPAKRSTFEVKARGETADAAKVNAYNEVLGQMENKLIEMRNLHRAWDNDIRFARQLMSNIQRSAQAIYNAPTNTANAKAQIVTDAVKWQNYKVAETQKVYTCDGKRYSEDATELRSKVENFINKVTVGDEKTQVYEDDFFITTQMMNQIVTENNKVGKSAEASKAAASKILEFIWQWEKMLSDIVKE